MSPVRHKMRRRPRSNPCGVLQVNARGYAFVKTAEGEVFVPASKRGGAFDGDMVEVALVSVNHKHRQPGKEHNQTGDKPTARVVRVIDRAHDYVTGRYEVAEPFGVVVPDDPRIPYDIFTLRSENPSLEDGAMVKVRITEYPSPRSAATGVIVEAAPAEEESDRATWALIARHKLETEFTAEALDQARSACLDEAAALAEGYRDLRDRLVFTIDPEDARDFDDALSLEEDEGMMRLGVHIADVARFVPWDCPLDSDAARRATSVYLADRVIPMLPEELSAELCSLKPGETRAALSVDLFLDSACRLVRYTVYPALIRSSARFSYEEVQNALEASGQCCAEGLLEGRGYSQGEALGGHRRNCAADPAFRGRLERLDRIARTLSAQRKRTGGIDFSTCEAKVRLDASGRPEAILLRKRTAATALVEEAMILANTTIA
ncbi:MAG: ribonuclease R, partial [Coriobacteriaceae bacterium]|nr:ribonuclease R [Coriobacteriaceae bacterium]